MNLHLTLEELELLKYALEYYSCVTDSREEQRDKLLLYVESKIQKLKE